ncbi:hypothetical protein [Paenibacillus durus]|uniref:Uncharacterized protein n=1 Tax=Paenibacillus durus TaxID=44251 RepID=A0A089HPA2_PAEDU|nr:hypothetical protein [Paenibacillus durus]AIQ13831.1 hypothetical protein PDUR_19360 [Paenibacillus durus]
MSLKKNRVFVFLAVIMVFVIMYSGLPIANASPVNPHWYAAHRLSATNTGIYSSITNDQEDLSHVSGTFINKEMWLVFNTNATRWIEAGTTRGPVNNSDGYVDDWHGHFIAYQTASGDYHERNVETEYKTGTHNFQISRDTLNGSTNWTIYFDYTQVATIPSITDTSGIYHDVGIESSDSDNSFTSGTYSSAIQYRNTSGSWVTWSSSTATRMDITNGTGWSATYSSSNNRLTYTH